MYFPGVICFKTGKVSVRMCTLLLDNCNFEYSVLYFTAPCGLEDPGW